MSLLPSRGPAVALHALACALSGETALLAALRSGNEDAFGALADAYGAVTCRVALTFVRSSTVAGVGPIRNPRSQMSKQKPPVTGGLRADDGTRTHDLLHGKQTL